MDAEKILQFYQEKLYREFNLIPVLGCELEFYVIFDLNQKIWNLFNFCRKYPFSTTINNWHSEMIQCNWDIVTERGLNQFEIRLNPTTDIFALCDKIQSAQKNILETLEKYKAKALFAAKPFADQPGSAMHFHLNFKKTTINDNTHIKNFEFTIGGLLNTIADLMIFFAPNADSYKRYNLKSMTSPSKISWGYNNRTTALRLIKDSKAMPRIEHRVSGADADPLTAIAAILCGCYLGLKKKISPIPPVYGLAFDDQYNLISLPISLAEAKKNFTKSKFSAMFNSFR